MKQPRCPAVECAVKPTIHTMSTTLQCKETEYWYTQLGWTSSVLWWMKKVSLNRSPTVWLHMYNIINSWNEKIIKMKNRLMVTRDRDWRGYEIWVIIKGNNTSSSFVLMEQFYFLIVVLITWMYICAKTI